MQLYIANKNYSSWSLRPWLLMTHAGIDFQEIKLRLDFDAGSDFKEVLTRVAPTGRVPVLVDEGFAVWDTLAIAEYLAEKYPASNLWPAGMKDRARARSLCAEMHAGFGALRNNFPMNIEASLPHVGNRILASDAAAAADLRRIGEMWTGQLAASGGPFLFGAFSIADAYFAPVCARVKTYGLPLPATAAEYVDRVHALPAMRAWVEGALAEHDFIPADEPYRTQT
ncbi:glutathione S-transferase family protein [soil metagenome]